VPVADIVVGILIPSGDTWSAKTAMSLLALSMHFYSVNYATNAKQALFFVNKRGSILPQLRQKMVESALAKQPAPTHLLLVDSDQSFPPDLLHQLLYHDAPVVACNIATKSPISSPTARLKGKGEGEPIPVFTRSTSPAVGEVWRVGCGIMLVRADVFSHLPKPWFNTTWHEEVQDFVGEDWWFCELLEKAGIPILVDHRISLGVGHIGDKEYTHADVKER
jgi:hypothetical protein